MEKIDITIIGAGVVGLAVAAELSAPGRTVAVLERNDGCGRETSSRNSGVIHSGIYYPEGSLKARLCVEGAGLLFGLCRKAGIPHRRTGKLIVATEEQERAGLEALFENGRRNSVADLRLLDRADIARREPAVDAIAAILSPRTGIIDVHALMDHLHGTAAGNGALFAFRSEADRITRETRGFTVGIKGERERFFSRIVVNCAGLAADRVAALADVAIDRERWRLRFCKGSYFSYAGPSPVSTLVYPLPHKGLAGLGVHATLDLGGRLRFGPDVEYTERISYTVDGSKRDRFFEAASRFIRSLRKEAFLPEMAGIRPKLSGPGEPARDFVISDGSELGLPGFINLIGIESPGLTAAPAIARHVGSLVKELPDA